MISVIVPVYNEENSVVRTLVEINQTLKGFAEYEIIVVNDGSTDATFDRVKEANIENLKIVNHIENLGYGRSIFDGVLASRYDCVAIIDGDGSYPASKIAELYKYYPQYDMVVGARTGSEYKRGIFKRPARLVFKFLAEYATGRKIPDVNSGLRIFKKGIVLNFQDSLSMGFSFTTTLTLIFSLKQYYVKYVPIEYLKRDGKSKVGHFRDTLRAGQIIVEAILEYNPIKLFLLLAMGNSFLGALIGAFNFYLFKLDFLSIYAGISVASFIPVFSAGLIAKKLHRMNT